MPVRHPTLARLSQRTRRTAAGSVQALLELLFPPVCSVCNLDLPRGVQAIRICQDCRSELVAGETACPHCARPLPQGQAPAEQQCTGCRGKRWRFERATALGVYRGKLRDAVLRAKQRGSEPLTVAVGQLLAEQQSVLPCPDLISPVPMHWLRRLTRGVNCPEILAEVVAARLRVPRAADLLSCQRKTKKQGTLLPTERSTNVRGAYSVSKGYDISGAHVMLVDDVMTTGATVNEIAGRLHQAGARLVSVAVIARGIGFD